MNILYDDVIRVYILLSIEILYFSGMTMSACSPKLGYGLTNIMSNYYPERLGLVICINHNRVFQGVWNAFKGFLHPNTIAKMQLLRSKKKIKDIFERTFGQELIDWLTEEIKLNKTNKPSKSQREFWRKPDSGSTHDPRGTASYIRQCIDNESINIYDKIHKPHPNIVDAQEGRTLEASELDPEREAALDRDDNDDEGNTSDSSDSFSLVDDVDIPDDQRVPCEATRFNAS